MSAIAGSIASLSLAGRIFSVTADSDGTLHTGGFTNEVMANGDGTARTKKTRSLWSLKGVEISIDQVLGDQEFLQDISNSLTDVVVLITYASGVSYQATGTIVSEIEFGNQNSTVSIDLSGPGTATKQ